MRATTRGWGRWTMLASVGVAAGWALRCQTLPSHKEVGMGEACASCHGGDYQRASQPLHAGMISTDCAACHSNTSWAPARGSNHSFPLDGTHAVVACAACHLGEPPLYEGTPSACDGCHQSDRERAIEPSHESFSRDCASCHGTLAWQPAAFSHEWPLEGAHSLASCASCHGEPPVYDGTPSTCLGCHQGDRDAVVQPSHAGFSEECGTCHGTDAWRPAQFPEHEWPLEGAHSLTSCASCHGEPPVYEGTSSACVACHEADRAGVVEPPHDGFSVECQSCHGTASWAAAAFEHALFPLTGAHEQAECGACHTGAPAVFQGTASECVACHQADFDASPFPGHAQFATTCQDCHSTAAWVPASGGAHPQQRFSITGDHAFACNECHDPSRGPNGAANADCVGCHEGEHTLSRMDNEHLGEVRNYPTGPDRTPNFCLQCHPSGRE